MSHEALRGVSLSIPPTADVRRSEGAGCGQISRNLPQQAERALVLAFSEAGAKLSARAEWTLETALATATVGAAYQGSPNGVAAPSHDPRPDLPDLGKSATIFNGDNGHATVSLEGTLTRAGRIAWRGSVSGHADSVPCLQVQAKVREALDAAVDALRERVIDEIRAAP